jgi:hypothetical protein
MMEVPHEFVYLSLLLTLSNTSEKEKLWWELLSNLS